MNFYDPLCYYEKQIRYEQFRKNMSDSEFNFSNFNFSNMNFSNFSGNDSDDGKDELWVPRAERYGCGGDISTLFEVVTPVSRLRPPAQSWAIVTSDACETSPSERLPSQTGKRWPFFNATVRLPDCEEKDFRRILLGEI